MIPRISLLAPSHNLQGDMRKLVLGGSLGGRDLAIQGRGAVGGGGHPPLSWTTQPPPASRQQCVRKGSCALRGGNLENNGIPAFEGHPHMCPHLSSLSNPLTIHCLLLRPFVELFPPFQPHCASETNPV